MEEIDKFKGKLKAVSDVTEHLEAATDRKIKENKKDLEIAREMLFAEIKKQKVLTIKEMMDKNDEIKNKILEKTMVEKDLLDRPVGMEIIPYTLE